jgi:hypothetical protein
LPKNTEPLSGALFLGFKSLCQMRRTDAPANVA